MVSKKIQFIKKNKRFFKNNKNLVIAVVIKRNISIKIIEVLGNYDNFHGKLTFNVFRFLF